jgi:hypothetical protein
MGVVSGRSAATRRTGAVPGYHRVTGLAEAARAATLSVGCAVAARRWARPEAGPSARLPRVEETSLTGEGEGRPVLPELVGRLGHHALFSTS